MRVEWHRRRGAPVDTHVLVHHSIARPEWLEQCLASLDAEPTNVLLVRSGSRNVGALRAAAMREGNAPLLSFVDDDDWVMPGAIARCVDALTDASVMGVYTDLADVDPVTLRARGVTRKPQWSAARQLLRPFEVLHLHVFRRAAAMPHLDELARWSTLEEALLMGLMVQHGPWSKLDVDGYRKRMHGEGAGARITPEMLRQLTMRLVGILRPPPRPTPRERVQRWAATHTGCRTCDGVRATVGRVVAPRRQRSSR